MLNFRLGAVPPPGFPQEGLKSTLHSELCYLIETFLYHADVGWFNMFKEEKKNSMWAFLGLLQMLKPKIFRGRCPLDPHRGSAPGPRQGPLSGPLDPTPLDAPLSWIDIISPDSLHQY